MVADNDNLKADSENMQKPRLSSTNLLNSQFSLCHVILINKINLW